MKIKVITSYKPGTWPKYAERSVKSVIENWPDVAINVYHEGACEESKMFHPRVKWIDLHEVQPELVAFKERHKDDPVACGELEEIEGGVRRPAAFNGNDKNKGSFLFDAVRFANKVFCVTHSIKTSVEKDYDYVIQNFAETWESLYINDKVFELLEWHDSYVFWHLSKWYREFKKIEVNDIGYWKGVKGHHVFVNSELGLYIDHFKGKRKNIGSSAKNDLRGTRSSTDVSGLDYWKSKPANWR